MPREYSVGSIFYANTTFRVTRIDRQVELGPPASREIVVWAGTGSGGLETMTRVQTMLEKDPTHMRLVALPLFFEGCNSFSFQEYVQVLCRILQLATPNRLKLMCSFTGTAVSEAALDTIRRVLCPALLACDSLVHVGVSVIDQGSEKLVDFIDDVFSSTPSCHSLYVGGNWDTFTLGELLVPVLRKRAHAHVTDSRFHRITRIQVSRFGAVPTLTFIGVELSRNFRVLDFCVVVDDDNFFSRNDIPEYMNLLLRASQWSVLSNALSSPGCVLRGLLLESGGIKDMPMSIAEEFGEAVGVSQLEEITVVDELVPGVLDAFASGVGRSQLQFLSIGCAQGCNVEKALANILECPSLRELLMTVPGEVVGLSDEALARVFGHASLEYCSIGELVPAGDAYSRLCDGNFAQSMRALTLLLLRWVNSFTELPAVDINLFRFIRTLSVMPTA